MGKYLIIGASGDIGTQITRDLLDQGHEVIAHYFHSDINNLMNRYKNYPISFVRFDLSEMMTISPFDDWMISHLDGLIYAAGTAHFASIQDITDSDINAQYHIHLANLIKVTQWVLPGLLQNQWGRIVVISSIWGETGSATESVYSAMKAGQIGFIKSIAKELALTNVTANIVAPGIVSGKMTLQLDEDAIQSLISQLPQKRLVQASEVSHAVLHLLDEFSQSVTGTVYRVNGGWLI
ncbi:elongation factor P 5-aminopentanone reductase [Macrococcus equi]|uniref:elongation factor P 5-aminopentanone reductase n=1 Tax=Macrococcus equi TaxID=3395462 RepID=UPI0039BE673A